MNAPLIISGPILREVLARAVARREACKVRAWMRTPLGLALLVPTIVVFILAAAVWAFAIFGL